MYSSILTVTQLNYSVRHLLENQLGSVWLIGEISNFSQPASGHWYLTLKDEQAQVRCAMFRLKNQRVNFLPRNGIQVLARANVSLYEPRGDYQLILESMELAGEGLLQQQFEQLKIKLEKEGLFDQRHKKLLPTFIKRIGVITSASGAVLQDILNILKRRDPSLAVIIYPTLVQGKEAVADIVSSIEIANKRQECDVLIVGRGGGSLEDLACFNQEAVARAIFHSHIPIISAVGHETDTTIADFVADLRASTPSAAAELVSEDRAALIMKLRYQFEKANIAFDRFWGEKHHYFNQLQHRLLQQNPRHQMIFLRQTFSLLKTRIARAIEQQIVAKKQQCLQLEKQLLQQHPQQKLLGQQQQLTQLEGKLHQLFLAYWQQKNRQWQTAVHQLELHPLPYQITELGKKHNEIAQRLQQMISQILLQKRYDFEHLCIQLQGLSPLSILSRGYSVTRFEKDRTLVSFSHLQSGERLITEMNEGVIISEVISFSPTSVRQ